MDIREVSPEEKRICIDKIKGHFTHIKSVLSIVEVDMESTELATQASSVWIGGQLCTWFSDFMKEINKIDQARKNVEQLAEEIGELDNDKTIN